ncbi:hypothetical protein HYQ44_020403 [Verticillium longisporum]|nr:hypothetical protein HYQ44_020403 [Verticillium longisporum]
MKNTAVLSAAAILVLSGVQAQDLPAKHRGVTVEPVPAGTVTEATNTETVTATATGGGAHPFMNTETP